MKHTGAPEPSLVRIRCVCGWFFYNENLKGKTDADLAFERDHEFKKHLESMRQAGR